jgi:predicted lactoylglutathione lyase
MTESRRARGVFINLPVADVSRAQSFFETLGFEADPRFSAEDRATCIVFSETVSAMLLSRETFKAFSPKPLANTATVAGVMTCLRMHNRDAIDEIMEAALANGATEARPPQDQAAMYGRAFEDPDGHIWELLWIDGES